MLNAAHVTPHRGSFRPAALRACDFLLREPRESRERAAVRKPVNVACPIAIRPSMRRPAWEAHDVVY